MTMNVVLQADSTSLSASTTFTTRSPQRCRPDYRKCRAPLDDDEITPHFSSEKNVGTASESLSSSAASKRKELVKELQGCQSRRTDLLRNGKEEEVYFCLKRNRQVSEEAVAALRVGNKCDHLAPSVTSDIFVATSPKKVLQPCSEDIVQEIAVDFSPRKSSPLKLVCKRHFDMDELIGIVGINDSFVMQEAVLDLAVRSNSSVSCNDVVASLTRDLRAASLGADLEWSAETKRDTSKSPRRLPSRTYSAGVIRIASPKNSPDFLSPVRAKSADLTTMVGCPDDVIPKNTYPNQFPVIATQLKPKSPTRGPGRTAGNHPMLRRRASVYGNSHDFAAPLRTKSDDLALMMLGQDPTRVGHAMPSLNVARTTPKPDDSGIGNDESSAAMNVDRVERRRQKRTEGESLQQLLKELKGVTKCSLRRCTSGHEYRNASVSTALSLRRATSESNAPLPANDGSQLGGSSHHRVTPILKTSAYEGVGETTKVMHVDKRMAVSSAHAMERKSPSRTPSAAASQSRTSIQTLGVSASSTTQASVNFVRPTEIDVRPEASTITTKEQAMVADHPRKTITGHEICRSLGRVDSVHLQQPVGGAISVYTQVAPRHCVCMDTGILVISSIGTGEIAVPDIGTPQDADLTKSCRRPTIDHDQSMIPPHCSVGSAQAIGTEKKPQVDAASVARRPRDNRNVPGRAVARGMRVRKLSRALSLFGSARLTAAPSIAPTSNEPCKEDTTSDGERNPSSDSCEPAMVVTCSATRLQSQDSEKPLHMRRIRRIFSVMSRKGENRRDGIRLSRT